jgi:hypothetical protein
VGFVRAGSGTRQLFCIALLVTGSVEAATAADYYVDSASGSDSNSGTTSTAPWMSLSKVNATTFQAGDVVHFKRGSAWTGNLQVRSSGTSASPVTYQAYGSGAAPQIRNPGVSYGNSITITGTWNIVRDFFLRDSHQSGIEMVPGADHNIVLDNEITASGLGVKSRGQYNLITQNYAHDLTMIVSDPTPNNDYGAVCFWLEAPNNEVSYNRGVNCRAPSFDFGHDGGFVEIYNQGDNSYVHHNYAENTNGFFELGAGNNGSARDVKVAYNVIYNVTAPDSGVSICFNTGSYNITVAGFRFENNTYISRGGDSSAYRVFGCRNDLTFLQMRNNIFYSDIQIANNGTTFTHSNNLYYMVNLVSGSGIGYTLGSGEKIGNPLFVNVAVGNLALLIGSPAIDAGLDLGYTKDFNGAPVPQGLAPDMGAYEFGLITFPAPQAPANVRILR